MRDLLVLPDRLKAVAALIPECEFLSDIGTDHAYIPIYAVKNKKARLAAAADIVDGPLKIASANIKSYNLSDKISVVKSNGLENIPPSDVIVIAGMGGTLIGEILKKHIQKAYSTDTLILQPMTCAYDLRKELHRLGFKIIKETIAKDSKKLYNIMVVKKGIQTFDDDIYYHIGKYLIDSKDPLLKEYIMHGITVLERKITNMQNSKNPGVKQETEKCLELLQQYRRVGDQID